MNKLLIKSCITNAEVYKVNEKCYTVYRNNTYYATFDVYEVAVCFALDRSNFPAQNVISFPQRKVA
jgi:hypothetical protein